MRESSDIIKQFFDRDIVSEGEKWVNLISSWEELVGKDLATHLNVKDLQSGTLLIQCDHPGWAQIFYLKKGAILRKLKGRFPHMDIRTFRVFCGEDNINRELQKTGKIIEESHINQSEEKHSEGERPPEFNDLLNKLRNLGD